MSQNTIKSDQPGLNKAFILALCVVGTFVGELLARVLFASHLQSLSVVGAQIILSGPVAFAWSENFRDWAKFSAVYAAVFGGLLCLALTSQHWLLRKLAIVGCVAVWLLSGLIVYVLAAG